VQGPDPPIRLALKPEVAQESFMDNDHRDETQKLRRDYLELESRHLEEREGLLRVIHALGVVVAGHGDMAGDVEALENHLRSEGTLPLDLIETDLRKLKNKILPLEAKGGPDRGTAEDVHTLKATLMEACGLVRKMISAVLEDFYPLSNRLAQQAAAIHLNCREQIDGVEFKEVSDAFLRFVEGLKAKLSEDFRYVNKTFIILLNQVKELEGSLTKEFGAEDRLKELDYFEMKIDHEVGSIVNSFDIHTTLKEVKEAVIGKIQNIKRVVSLRREEETRRALAAQENIRKLQERISEAERDAEEMSRKAERFQMVAMKDALTGLYNRSAFDLKMENAIETFREKGETFSVMVFDVDKFKEINDRFGHVAGDKVLKKVAQSLRESFRGSDFIARYGGDEFVALIERLTVDMAREKIVNFRKNLAKRRFVSYTKGEINVTVSAGIATVVEGDTPESLIERADKTMYAMKQGRSNM
jgi:diguanylate cyclase (GGDEF)-like protein